MWLWFVAGVRDFVVERGEMFVSMRSWLVGMAWLSDDSLAADRVLRGNGRWGIIVSCHLNCVRKLVSTSAATLEDLASCLYANCPYLLSWFLSGGIRMLPGSEIWLRDGCWCNKSGGFGKNRNADVFVCACVVIVYWSEGDLGLWFSCGFWFMISDAFRRPLASAHPGIVNPEGRTSDQKHYSYYQWVCFVLFFQALLCYFPKWLWENWEHGLMKTIVCGLNIGLRSDEEKTQKKSILIDYLIKHLNVSFRVDCLITWCKHVLDLSEYLERVAVTDFEEYTCLDFLL